MNNFHPSVVFRLTVEDNEGIHFIDLLTMKRKDKLGMILQKTCNHQYHHALCPTTLWNIIWQHRDFLLINCRFPLRPQRKQQELNTIIHISQNSGYPTSIITQLNMKIRNENKLQITNSDHVEPGSPDTWITFTYYNPLIKKFLTYSRTPILRQHIDPQIPYLT